MMKTPLKSLIFILAMATLLQACVASKSPANRRSTASSSVKNGTTTTPTTPKFASDESLYWFSADKVIGTITLNLNTENIVYLRGKSIHDFLVAKDALGENYYRKQFCLVGTYKGTYKVIENGITIDKPYKQLRVRAVPIFISNFTTKAIERLLRVDIPSPSENQATCGVSTINLVAPGTATSAYSLAEICPTCPSSGSLTSTSIQIFERKFQTQIAPATLANLTSISLAGLNIKVDLQSNSTTPGSLCSNSACEAKAFDCCIEGQCVKDASLKNNASSDPLYTQAIKDYAINPLSFINYPNIYNVCSNINHNPPPVIGTNPTPISAAEQRVKNYFNDYSCINKHESNLGTSTCTTSAYDLAKKTLAIACGCPVEYTAAEREVKCPNWGVRPLYKSQTLQDPTIITNIVDFYCYAPVPENPLGPITNLNVNVPSRSAPHRFYSTTGTNYDVLTKLASTIIQEGEDFFYLDAFNKNGPVNGKYNINSILGRMNVALSQTNPAKLVNVELGKTYILSATSGFFTPCSQCAKDSWFQTFTAHPSTSGGSGLRAVGYTTSRDTFSGNTTYGNYEDTKFGRACYVPVTMLPFSHKKEVSLIDQRQNRLKTQSALFINGYQRDWYGFNKGALIGSFDGVIWFAVGAHRRITATSTKLFLAINGAFLDLADRTDTIVNIIPDLGSNIVSDYDYDPELALNSPQQNTAGSCQQYHQCSTDSDCITQVGWEYSCVDVAQMRSKWPLYDSNAVEIANSEKSGTIFEILSGTTNVGGSSKRCVYRGAGAPCVTDTVSLNGNFNQKALTCAPNFFCAALTGNRFNEELARSPNEIGAILFGMDANVLGRPLNYVVATKTLDLSIVNNLRNSATTEALALTPGQTDDMGICRPGKQLSISTYPFNAATAHANSDIGRRTDFISQVGSCDATHPGHPTNPNFNNRFLTCPVFGDDLNYVDPTAPDLANLSIAQAKQTQNSCGGEARNPSTALLNANASAFKSIEAISLLFPQNILMPTLVQDACYRRAGSVCHTDLDCGPNKMHEEIAGSMALSYFGGTEAEQNYWKESLVCGQGQAVPVFGTKDFLKYNITQNRCCREVGKDFTMHTQGNATLVPDNAAGNNSSLITSQFAVAGPSVLNRYSRYTVSPTANRTPSEIPRITAGAEPAANQWKVINETGSLNCCGGGWIRKFADGTHDWKIKNRLTIDTSNFQCINFRSPLADPSYNNFAADKIVQLAFQREFENFCRNHMDELGNGCYQVLFPKSNESNDNNFGIVPPFIYDPEPDMFPFFNEPPLNPAHDQAMINTTPTIDPIKEGKLIQKSSPDAPYIPDAYYFVNTPPNPQMDVDGDSKLAFNFFTDRTLDYGVSMYLPAYIPYNLINPNRNKPVSWVAPLPAVPAVIDDPSTPLVDETAAAVPVRPNPLNKFRVFIHYKFENANLSELVEIYDIDDDARCTNVINNPPIIGQPVDRMLLGTGEGYCITHNNNTENRPVISVKAYTGTLPTTDPRHNWKYAGIVIAFVPLEIINRENLGPKIAVPGSSFYYLTKLGRLELVGIPQITYEPLYCSNNHDNLVPGIFKPTHTPLTTLTQRAQFQTNSLTYTTMDPTAMYGDTINADNNPLYGNDLQKFTYQDKLDIPPIFSSKDFACCTPLGKETTSASKCCSGFSALVGTKQICKLPTGTNLNVYFNKFVSSEGVGVDQPGGEGLITDADPGEEEKIDFIAHTGEPKLRESTNDKIQLLGEAYCHNPLLSPPGAVTLGGAFGNFPPEPFAGTYNTPPDGIPNSGTLESTFPLSIVDSIVDFETAKPERGKFPFDNGLRWNHHYYCK